MQIQLLFQHDSPFTDENTLGLREERRKIEARANLSTVGGKEVDLAYN
jgi:hypothetical protein